MVEETYTFEELNVKKDDVKQVLGQANEAETALVNELIDQTFSEAGEYCNIHCGYKIFEDAWLNKNDYSLAINKVDFKIQRKIGVHLGNLEKIAVFAGTAGMEISNWSNQAMKDNILKGYIIDILGSGIIEAAIDKLQARIKSKMEANGLKISNRYSPGYCDWALAEQQKLFSLLPPSFCGITLTDSSLMQPFKSVSGIIAIGEKVKYNAYTCNICEMENCIYRQRTGRTLVG